MSIRWFRISVSLAAIVALAACSGSGGLPGGAKAVSPSPQGHLVKGYIVVHIPRRHPAHARSHYIPATAQSLEVSFTPAAGGPPTTYNANLNGQNPDCTGVPLVCSIPIDQLPGLYNGVFATYDGALNQSGVPTGNVLSANQSASVDIVAGTTNHINVTLWGVPYAVTITELTGFSGIHLISVPYTSATVQVTAQDADQNTILGDGAPTPSIASANSQLISATQVGTSNTFTLTSPQAGGGESVKLTATETPNAASKENAFSKAVTISLTPVVEISTNDLANNAGGGIAQGPGGNMWFAVPELGWLYQVNPQAPYTFSGSQGSEQSWAVASGPDGNLWFTGGSCGIFTAPATFPANPPALVSNAMVNASLMNAFDGITAGADNKMWFTEGNTIGNLTTGGTLSEFPLANTSAATFAIAAGPQNTLWFTDTFTGSIGTIPTNATPGSSAQITMYTDGISGPSQPVGIVEGPDGAMWFTDQESDVIGRITTTGTTSTFADRPAGSSTPAGPTGIAVGSDGALWYTEYAGNNIGRITTDGVVTEYAIPTANAQPQGISAGPNGTIWFTEGTTQNIGVLTLSQIAPSIRRAHGLKHAAARPVR